MLLAQQKYLPSQRPSLSRLILVETIHQPQEWQTKKCGACLLLALAWRTASGKDCRCGNSQLHHGRALIVTARNQAMQVGKGPPN